MTELSLESSIFSKKICCCTCWARCKKRIKKPESQKNPIEPDKQQCLAFNCDRVFIDPSLKCVYGSGNCEEVTEDAKNNVSVSHPYYCNHEILWFLEIHTLEILHW